MKFTPFLICCAIWPICVLPFEASGQTIYGLNGLIKIPDAYTTENGKATASTGSYSDYFRPTEPNLFRKQWSVGLNVGFHSRLDVGLRIIGIPSVPVQASNFRYDFYIDRVASLKMVLITEKGHRPQVSIGAQDIIGTRLFNSTYIVVSKKTHPSNNLQIAFTFGWGTKLSNLLFDNAFNHRFIGPFGGVDLRLNKWGILLAEYDGKDVNIGIGTVIYKWLELRAFALDWKELGGLVSIKFSL